MSNIPMYLDSLSQATGKYKVGDSAVRILLNTSQGRERAEAIFEINKQRLDALAPGHGVHLARELEFTYQRVIEQKYTALKALEMFPVDGSVPAGALTYRITSEDMTGSAKYHRGESYSMPSMSMTRNEEIRPVRHIINGFSLDMFELKASNYAGTNIRATFERAARRSMMEFVDAKSWTGSVADDVYGVITYPYVSKTASTITIDDSSTPEDILAELVRLAQLQFLNTDEVFSPDTLALPTRQREYIRSTYLSLASGNQETIEQAFLRLNGHIDQVMSVPHLRGAGEGGTDVLLFFKRNDADAIANVIPEAFQMLPAETQGFQMHVPCYMSHGGIRMWYPLYNLVVFSPSV